MKKWPNILICLIVLVWLVPVAGAAQLFEISGVVKDTLGNRIPGVAVAIVGGEATVTDAVGVYRLMVPVGPCSLEAAHTDYETATRSLSVASNLRGIDFVLERVLRLPETIVVQAIRADADIPITKKDLDQKDIEQRNYGEEMPFVIEQTPSITNYSEDGLNAGYSYFYLRGIHQTRINMTLDGVPLNDPEESAVYFANFGDFASAVQSIQIQRGVGTSTVGAASYGGSINFASVDPAQKPELDAEVGAGSFGSSRADLTLNSGQIGGGLALYGRISYQNTDGFKDNSGVNQHTLYYGGTWQNDRSSLKLFGFDGRERTQLSFYATEQSILEQNLRFNYLQPEEKDDFGQDLFQAQYTHLIGASSNFAVQAYYNGAQGWFRLFDDSTVKDVLRQYSINGYFAGTMLTYSTVVGRMNLTLGAHTNHFARDHFQDAGDVRQYTNTGLKNEASSFAKITYDLDHWHLYGDAQVRYARFWYNGSIDLDSVNWTFFNPKLGARYNATDHLGLYASVGKTTREPARSDMLSGEDNASVKYDLRAVKPERVVDFEAGMDFQSSHWLAQANVYAMEFRNEIAATGELNEVGGLMRRNVDRSHRRGLELDVTYQPVPKWKFTGIANLSRNRIEQWTQFYDVYDEEGNYVTSEPRVQFNVNPLLTPQVILNQSVEWIPAQSFSVQAIGRYVSSGYLDNTNNDSFKTPAFFNLDATMVFDLSHWWKAGSPRLRIQVNNVLDNRRLWPTGYSYLYLVRGTEGADSLTGIPYYYPMATRSAFVKLDFHL
jgi:iron complex outermembrane receptor protein